jgi:hypothetical protein
MSVKAAFRLVVLAGIMAAAPAARAVSLGVEGFAGWQDLRLSTQSVGNAASGREGTAIVGGDVLLDLAGLGVGLAVDKTVSGNAQPWAGSIMAGFLWDLVLGIRIEGLGEIGRRARDFGDVFGSNGATFLGLRPGVSLRVPVTPLRVGVTGLVRWPTSNGDIGSPDYGIVGRIGFELP